MHLFVSKQEMDSIDPAIWRVLPRNVRERLPARLIACSLNTIVLREGFVFLQRFLDRLFARLKYEEGSPWLQWKLIAAFYLIQEEVGPATLFHVGRRIYSTMPWPPLFRGIADAFENLDVAFRAAHGNAPANVIGGWAIVESSPGRMVVESSTLYPCHLEEGVATGICDAFPSDRARTRLLYSPVPRRAGGDATRFEVHCHAEARVAARRTSTIPPSGAQRTSDGFAA